MKHLFLDTNYFLHYPPCNEIDWKRLAEDDEVTLLVTSVVLRELNEKKDGKNANRTIQQRAADRLRYLGNLLKTSTSTLITEGILLTAIAFEPSIDFKEFRLSMNLNDDWLLAHIIDFRSHTTAAEIILITEDLGLRLKAIEHKIPVKEPPYEQRLQDKPDEVVLQNLALRKEIEEIKSARPILTLLFSDKKKVVIPKREIIDPLISFDHKTWIDATQKFARPGYRFNNTNFPNQSYETQLNTYKEVVTQTFRVDFVLSNQGKMPADDIDIFLEFPEGFDVADKPPARPRPVLSVMDSVGPNKSSKDGPFTFRKRAATANYRIKNLKHNLSLPLPSYVKIPRLEGNGFTIKYTICCANILDKIEGTLCAKFE